MDDATLPPWPGFVFPDLQCVLCARLEDESDAAYRKRFVDELSANAKWLVRGVWQVPGNLDILLRNVAAAAKDASRRALEVKVSITANGSPPSEACERITYERDATIEQRATRAMATLARLAERAWESLESSERFGAIMDAYMSRCPGGGPHVDLSVDCHCKVVVKEKFQE